MIQLPRHLQPQSAFLAEGSPSNHFRMKTTNDYMNSTRKYRISGISGINKRKMLWNVLLKKH